MGQIAGVRIFVSYSVFVAFAVLAGLVTMISTREKDCVRAIRTLPVVATTAVAIWCFGWVNATAGATLSYTLAPGPEAKTITIGLLGIEWTNPLYRDRPWGAGAILGSAILTLLTLIAFGIGCLAIHMHTRLGTVSDWSLWVAELRSLDLVWTPSATAT